MSEIVRLGDVCEKIFAGGDVPKNNYKLKRDNNFSIPIYTNGEHNLGLYGYTTNAKVTEPSITVSARGTIGFTAIRTEPFFPAIRLITLIPNDKINIRYLFYVTQNYKFDNGGTSIPQLTVPMLKDYSFPLPPLDEQNHIASVLDKVTDLIAKHKKQLELLDELVKARFVEMFGDMNLNSFNWERFTINDVCLSIVRGPFGSSLKKEFFVSKGASTYKVYEQKNAIQKSSSIGTYYINEEKFHELHRFECKSGDIIMSCSGTMGELYQLPDNCENGIINQALCKFTLNNKILPIFFLSYMKMTIHNLETKGSGIKNIAAVSYVKEMPINLPPIELQQQFSAFVVQTDKSKAQIAKSLEQLETLKKALMQKYFG